MAIFRRGREDNFTVVCNQVLKDERLSWKAKGIIAYIMSLPDDWEIHTKELVKHAADGRDSLMSGIRELKKYGYVIYNKYQDEETGKFIHEYDVYDKPQTENPEVENPAMDNPTLENPSLLQKTNELKKDKQNTNKTNSSSNSCSDSEKPNEKAEEYEPKFDETTKPYQFAAYLRDKIIENNPRQPVPDENPEDLEDWAVSLDRLNRLGTVGAKDKGYTWNEIQKIIDWCQDDDFWKANILSASKLRKQVVKLENRMKSRGGFKNGKDKVPKGNRKKETKTTKEEWREDFANFQG